MRDAHSPSLMGGWSELHYQSSRQSGISAADLARESLAGIVQRPGRSMLTIAGVAMGIGAFVAILGLTSTAAGQISKQFSVFAATQVTVVDSGDAGSAPVLDFPADADHIADHMNGVLAAGLYWQVDTTNAPVAVQPGLPSTTGNTIPVYAASPGLMTASGAAYSTGVGFSGFDEQRDQLVAVIGAAVARQLGISSLSPPPAIFIGDQEYTVIGILGKDPRLAALELAVVIPESTALNYYGPPPPASPATMLIHTRLGAAQLVARQAPVALLPTDPSLLTAVTAPSLSQLQHGVSFTISSLLLLLAAVTVAVGALGVANTTLVAVLERTGEIGLRRAMGARPRHIAAQILLESALLGLIGALVGTAFGILAVVAVSIDRQWTAVLSPLAVYPVPVAGAVIGLLAGIYPALRASTIEPAAALRR